jgi:hypothetical protein
MSRLISSTMPFFLVTLISILLSGLLLHVMIGRINRKVPPGQQISHLFLYPREIGRIHREYKRLHPRSLLSLLERLITVLAFLSFLGIVWRLGFFR